MFQPRLPFSAERKEENKQQKEENKQQITSEVEWQTKTIGMETKWKARATATFATYARRVRCNTSQQFQMHRMNQIVAFILDFLFFDTEERGIGSSTQLRAADAITLMSSYGHLINNSKFVSRNTTKIANCSVWMIHDIAITDRNHRFFVSWGFPHQMKHFKFMRLSTVKPKCSLIANSSE